MAITQANLTRLNTVGLVNAFSDRLKPKSMFRSMFRESNTNGRYISLQVQRVAERIATAIARGSKGNRNRFDKSTEKLFNPAFFNEWFDATELDIYDQLYYSGGEIDTKVWDKFIQTVAEKLDVLMDKIDRAYEKQCADALLTGKITLEDGTQIDYKRKTASITNLTGAYWDGANDPNVALTANCQFLRGTGKMQGNVVYSVWGTQAWQAYLNNSFVKARGQIFNWNFDKLAQGPMSSVGGVPQGYIESADYKILVWTYNDLYEDDDDNQINYMDSKKIIMVPEVQNFDLSYANSPQLLTDGRPPQGGKFLFYDYMDEEACTHKFGVKSAGAAVLTAVDQVVTTQVLA